MTSYGKIAAGKEAFSKRIFDEEGRRIFDEKNVLPLEKAKMRNKAIDAIYRIKQILKDKETAEQIERALWGDPRIVTPQRVCFVPLFTYNYTPSPNPKVEQVTWPEVQEAVRRRLLNAICEAEEKTGTNMTACVSFVKWALADELDPRPPSITRAQEEARKAGLPGLADLFLDLALLSQETKRFCSENKKD